MRLSGVGRDGGNIAWQHAGVGPTITANKQRKNEGLHHHSPPVGDLGMSSRKIFQRNQKPKAKLTAYEMG